MPSIWNLKLAWQNLLRAFYQMPTKKWILRSSNLNNPTNQWITRYASVGDQKYKNHFSEYLYLLCFCMTFPEIYPNQGDTEQAPWKNHEKFHGPLVHQADDGRDLWVSSHYVHRSCWKFSIWNDIKWNKFIIKYKNIIYTRKMGQMFILLLFGFEPLSSDMACSRLG